MAVLINAQNVDEKYSPILEPNLFYASVFVPGATCTDQYQTGPAGGMVSSREHLLCIRLMEIWRIFLISWFMIRT